MSHSAPGPRTTFDVLVVGGGNAGISTAARLLRQGVSDVAVLEPQLVHTYRPLLSYVGGGQASLRAAERTQRAVTPAGCTWLQDSAVAVDPQDRVVTCASGATYGYRDLVVVPGLVVDDEALPGVSSAITAAGVASNYLDHAEKTWRLIRDLPHRGRAVFTVPRPPVSCSGTTIKPLFFAAAHWARTGRETRMTLLVDRPGLLGVPGLDERLRDRLDELGVETAFATTVTGLDPDGRQITVTDGSGGTRRIDYDMLHLVPPFRAPRWLAESGLTRDTPGEVVDIDPETLRHRAFATVWAAGDAAGVDTDPSGGGLRRQVAVLVDNLLAARRGQTALSRYDGYTVAPIPTDAHRLIAAEFDRTGRRSSSLPSFLDPYKPRRSAWAFDRYGLPQMYWNLILKGRV
ncbi:sulfide:quinone oxidoreductase [Mycolicibacterium iranicum]|uniref:Sulfide:quinone oxidoreductase n=1 Tax=Mycolicibacterium iranicum TaxID=912594 RepID=A0A839QK67_MYCIR|nr:FAD/NAD(P)-binding oxidoreductase [Mycolicibacterium iranicum]MBB2993592.1 sulfide:quinone oxidoreductase [Mycolicibacterium iranicum]